jgi:hypothetical protein
MVAPDNPTELTFTLTLGVPSAVTIINGPAPNGTYSIHLGAMVGSNSEYIAVVTPVGVAEEQNFQAGDL